MFARSDSGQLRQVTMTVAFDPVRTDNQARFRIPNGEVAS